MFMKSNSILLAGLVSIGLLAIGAGSGFARGYFSVRNPLEWPASSGYHLSPTPANQAWERDNVWASYENIRRVADNWVPLSRAEGQPCARGPR